jgi:iron(III) transport system ATP-binding protein
VKSNANNRIVQRPDSYRGELGQQDGVRRQIDSRRRLEVRRFSLTSGGASESLALRCRAWLVLALLVSSGCADPANNTLVVSEFTTWKLPADGRRIPAPRALYADKDDTVYALDDAGRVLIYSSAGELQNVWRMPDYEVGRPEGIVKLLDGRVAVADTHYHRVVFFHPDGTVESLLGTQGIEPGQFVYPVAIAQDPDGFIYVGEYGDRQRIQKFDPTGKFIVEFGEHGTEPGQFQRPSGIAWSNGTIFAVDAFNNRIQAFSDSGEFLRIVELQTDEGGFEFPYDIRGTADGRLFVIENKSARITVLTEDGTLIGRYGQPGRSEGGFLTPWSLTVLSDGRVLVADTGNHRIVELTL